MSEQDPRDQVTPIRKRDEERQQARFRGYTGDVCNMCGNFTMVRTGTCLQCASCGQTTGCA